MKEPDCPLCGFPENTPLFRKNGFQIVRCCQCDLQFVHPIPDPETLKAHYQQEAYFHGEASQGYREYTAMRKALLPHFRRRMARIQHMHPGKGRLLDFGCAAGYFLEVAQAAGWDVAGVEISQSMARAAEARLGIPIRNRLEEIPGHFDAITLWEVVEHLPDPLGTLRALRARLKPGGWLMLSTPNTGHWQARTEPEHWEGYRPPSHLFFFTRETLHAVLERSGFSLVGIQGTAPLPPLPSWLRALTAPLQRRLADGSARPWYLARLTWRAVRMAAWGWQRLAHPDMDIYATLEAWGQRRA